MTKLSLVLRACVATAALSLAACSTPAFNGPEQAFDLNERYPISVQPRMMSLALPYNGQAALDQNTGGQLSALRRGLSRRTARARSASPAPTTQPPTSSSKACWRWASCARRSWSDRNTGAAANNDIRVTYIRYVAEVPPCGDWSTNLAITASNTRPPNFGCATQHNIAAMVADPRDLVAPDTSGQADAQRRLTVLEKYRAGEPTAAQRTEQQSAGVSTVGQ